MTHYKTNKPKILTITLELTVSRLSTKNGRVKIILQHLKNKEQFFKSQISAAV